MVSQLRTVSTDLGPATVLPTRYFLDHILPPLHPAIDLNEVIEKLKTCGKKSKHAITKAGRWWGFPKDPEVVRRHIKSSAAYKHFPRIIQAIADCGAPEGVEPSLQIVLNPEYQNIAERRNEASLPGAYMVPPETVASGGRWTDISIIGEYDRYSSAGENNACNLCWSISQAFNDPRRRSIFGYTMQNRMMRFWFCDKTQLLVSESLDFMTDHETVSHIFLSLLFAKPYQLGWDPSVRAVETLESGLQYDYIMHNPDDSKSTFRTVELLSSNSRTAVFGGGTRVWKVLQVIDAAAVGQPMVLKDTWIHAELEREGSALEKIRQSDHSSEFQESISANFLTVVCHGDVAIHSRGGHSYCDRTLHHVGNAEAWLQGKPLPDSIDIPPAPPTVPFSGDTPLSGRRVHYRIVFKEICQPLTLSTPLNVAFPVLAQICGALKLMHTAGWLHRDVSIGNILIDEFDHARLVDLEYAKKMGDDLIPELRVGTTPFISNEVQGQMYICIEQSPTPDPGARCPSPPGVDMSMAYALDMRKRSMRSARMAALGSKSPSPKSPTPEYLKTPPSYSPPPDHPFPRFHHNPLHDLESMFWIAAYFLFKTDGKSEEAEAIARRQDATRELFYKNLQRWFCIQEDAHFIRHLRALHTDVQPAGHCLDAWRAELSTMFYSAEKDCSSITCAVAAGLHDSLSRALYRMAELIMDSPVHPRNRKRVSQDNDVGLQNEEGEITYRVDKKPRIPVDSKN